MAGSDSLEGWRAGLLADGSGIPVVAVRDGLVHAANGAARRVFGDIREGMVIGELFEQSCRGKLHSFLEGATGASTELEVTRAELPPAAVRFLLLAAPGEQLLVGGASDQGYTEEIGAKLMAANTELADLTRELSKRMHELDLAAREMQKLAEQREMFIAALAHDLKAPLSVILLSESLLRKRTPAAQAIEMEQHIGKVERSAKSMLAVIDSLLFAAQLDSAEPPGVQSLESLLIDDIARETARDLAPLADDAAVAIEVTAPEPIRVRGNRVWLGQVFANLLTNAIRYSPAGTRVAVTVTAEGSEARCAVADRGPGVPPPERERIFERFVQRGERRGTIGLGLYICRKIMSLHGGRIWVEDHPGGGARFAFSLPLADAT
ncbi:MAG TPA: HAMP domain-containing sensor histidine kinase [Polyangiaceae bacterium]|nr:HAMP domain-containing sensor histidine kinase [Polyangiaceae bacterium]